MRVILKKKIRAYSKGNAQAELPLVEWYITMQATDGRTLTELRKKFNSVDHVHGYTIFNIEGNNYRLTTAIHYNTQRCHISTIWTHALYSKPYNQAKLKRGEL